MEDNKLKSLAGQPIHIDGIGNVHPLTLDEIIEIGKSTYDSYINALCFEVKDLGIDEDMEGYDELTPYRIIITNCTQDETFQKQVVKALSVFLKEDVFFLDYVEDNVRHLFFYVGDADEGRVIHNENYEELRMTIRHQNNIITKKEDEYNPGNEMARKLIEQIKKGKEKAQQVKPTIDIHSIMSGVAWKGEVGISEVCKLTLYQLYDAYYRLNSVDEYDNTMRAIYAGTIDVKSVDVKKINWSNIIKLD